MLPSVSPFCRKGDVDCSGLDKCRGGWGSAPLTTSLHSPHSTIQPLASVERYDLKSKCRESRVGVGVQLFQELLCGQTGPVTCAPLDVEKGDNGHSRPSRFAGGAAPSDVLGRLPGPAGTAAGKGHRAL